MPRGAVPWATSHPARNGLVSSPRAISYSVCNAQGSVDSRREHRYARESAASDFDCVLLPKAGDASERQKQRKDEAATVIPSALDGRMSSTRSINRMVSPRKTSMDLSRPAGATPTTSFANIEEVLFDRLTVKT